MDTKKNYYKILDVDKKADAIELKKKYREMSKKHHPDLNNGETKDLFSDINEAYNILSDNTKRMKYDTSSVHGAAYDMKNELYNFTFSNKNVQYDEIKKKYDILKKSSNDVLLEINDFDGDIDITYQRYKPCLGCDGSGLDLTSLFFDCDMCQATGMFNDNTCTVCSGKGLVGINKCTTCKGEATILVSDSIIINRESFKDNKFKIPSMGNYSKTNLTMGNLYIKIRKDNTDDIQ